MKLPDVDIPGHYFTVGWVVWFVYFLVLEALALIDKERGDTLSEHVWFLRHHGGSLFWFMLAGFLVWLTYHMLFEGGI